MSMIFNLKRVAPPALRAMMRRPDTIEAFVQTAGTWFDPTTAPDGEAWCMDKAWHGVHYLLTGSAWGGQPPLNFLVAGPEIGDVDVGYGPARAHAPEAVGAIAAALATVSEATLRATFDPGAMEAATVYPTVWTRDGDAALAWLLGEFAGLREFVAAAAAAGDGLVLWLD